MTVEKIIRIENVGRFSKFNAADDISFRRLTLVFGMNGSGKTTLANVFRSLRDGDATVVNERATLGAGQPAIELRLAGQAQNVKFVSGAWSVTAPHVEIYDTAFVSDNVYSGEFVENEHRKNLYNVIVGPAAVAIAKEIDALDAQGRAAAKKIADLEEALRARIQAPFSVDDFLVLKGEDGVEAKITTTTSALNASRKAQEIVALPHLEELVFASMPDGAVELLSTTLETISNEARERVSAHIHSALDRRGEQWLAQGLEYLRDDKCPFCAQETKASSLVALYPKYFSSAYQDNVVRTQRMIDAVERQLGEAAMAGVAKKATENDRRIALWRDVADVSLASFDTRDLADAAALLRERLLAALREKLGNPAVAIVDLAPLQAAVGTFQAARQRGIEHAGKIAAANAAIAQTKQRVSTSIAADIEGRLRELRNMQIRMEADVAAQCDELTALKQERKDIEKKKKEKKDALTTSASSILQEYQTEINRLLQCFGASFQITDAKPNFSGGKASSSYSIMIDKQTVDLGDSKTPRGKPTFRSALSAADKTTLALAFFLARLSKDADIARKIVVLDDPMSSLDCFRSAFTQQEIGRLAGSAAQVIVLSHDPFFLDELANAMGPQRSIVKTLEVGRGGTTHVIRPWDHSKACLPENQKDYFILVSFLAGESPLGGDLKSIAQRIRPLLEGYLRGKYPKSFARTEWLGDFIGKLRDANAADEFFPLKARLNDLSDINDFSKQFMHGGQSGSSAPISESSLRAFVERSLTFIHGA